MIIKNVAAAEASGKPITDSMEKPNVSLTQFQKLINILLKNYREEKFASNQEAVRDLV